MPTPTDDLTAVDRVERAQGRKGIIAVAVIAMLLVIAVSFVLQMTRINRPVTYANDEDHFRYGSIGSDVAGVPYWVFRVMPEICPADLPGGYASLGVIQEPGRPTPIGFSMRKVGPIDTVVSWKTRSR